MTVKRWTDEMLDELASTVAQEGEKITELRDSIDGLRITSQALLQVAAQQQQKMDLFEEEMDLMKQRQAENDQRFYRLLEEVRFLNRGKKEE